MPVISKSKLKANMLQVFREIEESGEELIITHNSRPVLRVHAIERRQPVRKVFEDLQDKVVYFEDINTPTIDEWDET